MTLKEFNDRTGLGYNADQYARAEFMYNRADGLDKDDFCASFLACGKDPLVSALTDALRDTEDKLGHYERCLKGAEARAEDTARKEADERKEIAAALLLTRDKPDPSVLRAAVARLVGQGGYARLLMALRLPPVDEDFDIIAAELDNNKNEKQ